MRRRLEERVEIDELSVVQISPKSALRGRKIGRSAHEEGLEQE